MSCRAYLNLNLILNLWKEIEWKISDDFIRIYCSSKDKKFLKEFGAQNCENFYVDMLADSSKIDKQSIAIHRHHRKV